MDDAAAAGPPTPLPSARGWLILSGIVLVAIGVRVWPMVVEPENQRNGLGQFGDSFGYHRIAANILRGNGFSATYDGTAFGQPKTEGLVYEPAITRPPGYPYFLAAVYRAVGAPQDARPETWRARWSAARLVQALLDAALCILLFGVARGMTRSDIAGYGAAALHALNPYSVFYTRQLLSESVSATAVTLAMAVLVVAVRRRTQKWWFVAGIAIGTASLVSAQLMLLPLLVALWLLWHEKAFAMRMRLRFAALCLAGSAAGMFPWTVRNAVVFHRVIPIAIAPTGWGLLLGAVETKSNWVGWTEVPAERFPNPADRAEITGLLERLNSEIQGGSMAALETNERVWKFVSRTWRDSPGKTVSSWLQGVPRLWYQNQIHMFRDREPSGAWLLIFMALAAVGWIRAARDDRVVFWPAALLVIYLTGIFLPLHVESRYSVIAIPTIIAAAGPGIDVLLRRFRQTLSRDARGLGVTH